MTMRILLPLFTFPDASPDAGIRNALGLAAALGAKATALVHEVNIPPVTEPLANIVMDVTALSEAAERLSRTRGEHLKRLAESEASRLSLQLEIDRLRTDRLAGEAIAAVARTYDFTFLAGLAESPDHAMLMEDVLFRSGGPAILIPAEPDAISLETVAVGWDGSRAASRALRDALPVLQRASRVVLLIVTDDKDIPADASAGAAAFLSSHGVEATVLAVAKGASTIGEALQNRALEQEAGLLVMGAYGHSRLREFILGGATKTILAAPRLAVLMSH